MGPQPLIDTHMVLLTVLRDHFGILGMEPGLAMGKASAVLCYPSSLRDWFVLRFYLTKPVNLLISANKHSRGHREIEQTLCLPYLQHGIHIVPWAEPGMPPKKKQIKNFQFKNMCLWECVILSYVLSWLYAQRSLLVGFRDHNGCWDWAWVPYPIPALVPQLFFFLKLILSTADLLVFSAVVFLRLSIYVLCE